MFLPGRKTPQPENTVTAPSKEVFFLRQQSRLRPVGHAQFRQDVFHMQLDRDLLDPEVSGNFLVRQADAQLFQRLLFARRQGGKVSDRCRGLCRSKIKGEIAFARQNKFDRVHQGHSRQRFGNKSMRAGLHRLVGHFAVGNARHQNNLGRRKGLTGPFKTVQTVHARHVVVQNKQINRIKPAHQIQGRVQIGRRLHFETLVGFKVGRDGIAHQIVVVGNQDIRHFGSFLTLNTHTTEKSDKSVAKLYFGIGAYANALLTRSARSVRSTLSDLEKTLGTNSPLTGVRHCLGAVDRLAVYGWRAILHGFADHGFLIRIRHPHPQLGRAGRFGTGDLYHNDDLDRWRGDLFRCATKIGAGPSEWQRHSRGNDRPERLQSRNATGPDRRQRAHHRHPDEWRNHVGAGQRAILGGVSL
mmetsp:Transcript_401/g.1161  ORF Transcript_401/g.1161 Transcript_401/m.1161 type:complete len:413 (-) Transcript_401:705-1943(-)